MTGKFVIKRSTNGHFTFVLVAANGESIGRGELCTKARVRVDAIAVVKLEAPGAIVEDVR